MIKEDDGVVDEEGGVEDEVDVFIGEMSDVGCCIVGEVGDVGEVGEGEGVGVGGVVETSFQLR